MDCWIGVGREGDRRVVRLAGRLTAAQVPELLQVCEDYSLVDLNLVDLLSADMAGIDAMRRVRAGGARLIGTNGYIQIRLDSLHPDLA